MQEKQEGKIMNKYTKITASIGPNCEDKEILTRMISAGVNICRLNFSHDTGDVQGAKIDLIRSVSEELETPVAIMIDLQGPTHRQHAFLFCRHLIKPCRQYSVILTRRCLATEHVYYRPGLDCYQM